MLSSKWSSVCGLSVHRPMTLHITTETSPSGVKSQDLEANSLVQNVKLGGHQTCLSINGLWARELCGPRCAVLLETTAPGHHDCSIQE
ncbi:hypothetical protein TNCV_5016121 [Trichonephila clavipes]|nr:hypothetical protein TNCV_5016121 [Trichonephila clavipes]